jgi:hypothetical protein
VGPALDALRAGQEDQRRNEEHQMRMQRGILAPVNKHIRPTPDSKPKGCDGHLGGPNKP